VNLTWLPFSRMRDARRVIDASGLPDDLRAFVLRIVRRTKLRTAERADVARELCSHFHEALAAGRTPAASIAAYGDPAASARQLRAAAIAKRHPLDRAVGTAFRAVGWACVAFVAAYVGFTLYLHFKRPVISVDTLQVFRERLAAPTKPDDAAWPRYRDAMLALIGPLGDPERNSKGWEAVNDLPHPGDPGWDAATAWLAARGPALADLRDAARRPVFGFPAGREFDPADERLFGSASAESMRELIATRNETTSLPMLGILLPQLATMRSAARTLVADATQAAAVGDAERMVADLEATMAMSIHVQDGRILIGDLVGMAIRNLARQRTIELLEWKPDLPSAAQLARLQRAVSAVPPALERLDLGAERLMWVDLMQRFFTDDSHGNGMFRMDRQTFLPLVSMVESTGTRAHKTAASATPTEFVLETVLPVVSSPAAALLIADRRQTREVFESWATRFEDASRLPIRDHARFDALDAEFEREVGSASLRLILPRLMMPALSRACFAFAQDRAWATAATTACAAVRFHRDTGAWPKQPQDLVPAYLPTVPEDPWTGTPVHMGGIGDGFRIWSVGEDGTDDGGDPMASDGMAHDRIAPSVLCFRNDNRVGNANDAGSAGHVDWVWFAPRGPANRWHLPEPNHAE
jgi:hypothetical protein